MQQSGEILMQLIRNEVCGLPLHFADDVQISDKCLAELLILARKHDVSHLVASALIKNELLNESSLAGVLKDELYTAIFKYEKTTAVFNEVSSAFDSESIQYIPLKGMVIRDCYPQPWMRTSRDIDILVRKEDLNSAVNLICEKCKCTVFNSGEHDVTLKSADGIFVEIHFSLLGNKKSPLYSEILEKVWETAKHIEGCRYSLDEKTAYYYHILHMAKHFRIGGCGLRPFLDLWLIDKQRLFADNEVLPLLEKSNLLLFYNNAEKLSKVWFDSESHDETTLAMQEFIIEGGSFGSAKTRIASQQHNSGGKLQYIISRLFIPTKELKTEYPVLRKCIVLLPFFIIYRWLSLLFGKKKYLRKTQLKNANNVSQEHINDINLLFERVGL